MVELRSIRAFHFRHASGFTPRRIAWLTVGCHSQRGFVNGLIAEWKQLWPSSPAPGSYVIGQPSLSEDRLVATIALGGAPTYGLIKTVEDYCPPLFYQFLPAWFHLDLEWAYTNEAMGIEEGTWWYVLSATKRDELRSSDFYKWSHEHESQ